jgi:hypothetical protein
MSRLDQALEICLTRLQLEGASLEDCLRAYPELADQLRPLLVAAQKLDSLSSFIPTAEFKSRMRGTLLEQISKKPRTRHAIRTTVVMRYAASFAVLALAFLTTGTALAQRALPGDVLYHWKLESESVWRSLQTDTVGADILLGERRLDELKAIQGIPELEEIGFRTYGILLERLGNGLIAAPERVAGATQALDWQKAELKEFFGATDSIIPDLDALFDVIPDVDSNAPETPQDEGAIPDAAIPPVIPAIPPVKKEEDPADGGAESTIWDAISDLIGLP